LTGVVLKWLELQGSARDHRRAGRRRRAYRA
jgi:hypothetical protein